MHKLIDYSKGINQTLLCLIMAGIILSGLLLHNVAIKVLTTCRVIEDKMPSLDVDEKLAPYFSCLKGLDQKAWYANEVYLRNALQIKTVNDEALE